MEEAIPQQQTNISIYRGTAPPQYGPIPTDPATVFLAPQLKKPLYPFNLKRAKALLTSHGWKEVGGAMTQGGKKLEFALAYSSGTESTRSRWS